MKACSADYIMKGNGHNPCGTFKIVYVMQGDKSVKQRLVNTLEDIVPCSSTIKLHTSCHIVSFIELLTLKPQSLQKPEVAFTVFPPGLSCSGTYQGNHHRFKGTDPMILILCIEMTNMLYQFQHQIPCLPFNKLVRSCRKG